MHEDLIQRLEAALPVEDIVGWLIAEYPDSTEQQVMGMVQMIYQRDYDIRPAASEMNRYQVGDATWDACPQTVAAPK